MIVRLMTLAVLTTTLAGTASAQESQTAVPKKVNDPNRIVCKRAAPTGSLVPSKKDCRTQAQWDAEATAGNRNTRDMMERQSTSAYSPQ